MLKFDMLFIEMGFLDLEDVPHLLFAIFVLFYSGFARIHPFTGLNMQVMSLVWCSYSVKLLTECLFLLLSV